MLKLSARWLDLAERTVLTYVETFVGLLTADSTHMLSLGTVRAAAVAALPAAYAAIKSAFALGFGSSGTASLVPAKAPAAPGDSAPAGQAGPVA